MKLHKYCELIPAMSKEEFNALKASISRDGLIVPIVMLGDEILDGRHRYQACMELGLEPETECYQGKDPFSYAISLNATRRHLNQSQRAMLATDIATLKHGGNRNQGANLHLDMSINKASEQLQVSPRAIKAAKAIKKAAPPVVIKAIEKGSITLNAAQKVINNTEPELLTNATPAQLQYLAENLGTSDKARIDKMTALAQQLRAEYDALSRYPKSEEILAAFHNVHFELNLIGQIKQAKDNKVTGNDIKDDSSILAKGSVSTAHTKVFDTTGLKTNDVINLYYKSTNDIASAFSAAYKQFSGISAIDAKNSNHMQGLSEFMSGLSNDECNKIEADKRVAIKSKRNAKKR